MVIRKFKTLAGDEAGASSIFVILMMIVLVSLGYFAIASANSNNKLSAAALDWNQKYYYLDGKGEEFLAYVDGRLYNAQEKANAYLNSECYLDFIHEDLPLELHMSIYDGYASALDREFFLQQVMDTVFMFYADIELSELNKMYPDAVLSSLKEGDIVLGIICDLTITHPDAPYYHLDVSLSVDSYSSYASRQGTGNAYARRYKVINWSQWQNQPSEDSGPALWDGTIKTP